MANVRFTFIAPVPTGTTSSAEFFRIRRSDDGGLTYNDPPVADNIPVTETEITVEDLAVGAAVFGVTAVDSDGDEGPVRTDSLTVAEVVPGQMNAFTADNV